MEKTDTKIKETQEALAEFIIRVSKKGATPEEVQVLPEVARVFYKLFYPASF